MDTVESGSSTHTPPENPTNTARDIESLVTRIKQDVAQRRKNREYDAHLLELLDAPFSSSDSLDPPELLTYIASSRTLRSDRPLGKIIVVGKKVVRRLLSWYVHPITEDQTRFNTAILLELRSLQRRVDHVDHSQD